MIFCHVSVLTVCSWDVLLYRYMHTLGDNLRLDGNTALGSGFQPDDLAVAKGEREPFSIHRSLIPPNLDYFSDGVGKLVFDMTARPRSSDSSQPFDASSLGTY